MDGNEKDSKQKMKNGSKPRNPNLRLVKNGDMPIKGSKTLAKKPQLEGGKSRIQEKNAPGDGNSLKSKSSGGDAAREKAFAKEERKSQKEEKKKPVKSRKRAAGKKPGKKPPKEEKGFRVKGKGKPAAKSGLEEKAKEQLEKGKKNQAEEKGEPEEGKELQAKRKREQEKGKELQAEREGEQGKGKESRVKGKEEIGKRKGEQEKGKESRVKGKEEIGKRKGEQEKGKESRARGKEETGERQGEQEEGKELRAKGKEGTGERQGIPEEEKEVKGKEKEKPAEGEESQKKGKKQEKEGESQKSKSAKKGGKGKKRPSKAKKPSSKAKKTTEKAKKGEASAVKKAKTGRRKKEYQDKLDIGEWLVQNKSLVIIGMTAAAIVCVLVGIYRYIITAYEVTTVYVDGNVHYTNEEVMDMVMGGRYGNNSLYLAAKYKNKGIDGVPFVEKMDVNILSPDTIRISVYEKALAGYVEYLGRYMYFDRDGIVVESSEERTSSIPQVTGLKFDYIVLNDYLPVENDEIFKRILDITQLLNKYELMADKIFFDSTYDLTLFFDGIRVTLGSDSGIDQKIIHLKNILPNLEGKKGTLRMENYTEDTKNITFLQE